MMQKYFSIVIKKGHIMATLKDTFWEHQKTNITPTITEKKLNRYTTNIP